MVHHGLSDLVDFETNADHVALFDDSGDLTIADVDRRTNAIASRLRHATRPGDVVAILGDTTTETALAILGVLRAGLVVMALDPEQPSDYSVGLMQTARPALIVDVTGGSSAAQTIARRMHDVMSIGFEFLDDRGSTAPPIELAANVSLLDDPAVLFFSSGSSGSPSAVVYSRRTLRSIAERFVTSSDPLAAPERHAILMTFPYTMGGGTLLNALLMRTPVGCFDLRRRSIEELAPWLRRHAVTNLRLQASPFRTIVDAVGDLRDSSLRDVGVGGEPLSAADVRRFREVFPSRCRLVARYGCTETGPVANGVVVVGGVDASPVLDSLYPGVTLRIVDEQLVDLPHGEVGELLVHTNGLSAGYWNDPSTTADRFSERAGERWFHTRDLGRWTPSGLELKGRCDHRVKVRGYNVDLLDVERALRELPVVRDAAVVAMPASEGRLTLSAFVVPSVSRTLTVGQIRTGLVRALPNASVPGRFHILDVLPRLPNGKIDRVRLAAASGARPVTMAEAMVAPRTPDEHAVHCIVCPLIGVDELSVTEDLFDAGLDSLTSIECALALTKQFASSVSPADIIESRTIAGLALLARSGGVADRSVVRLGAHTGESLLTFVLVAGAGDLALDVLGLARHLSIAGDVFGVQGRGIGDGLPFDDDIAAFATRATTQLLRRSESHEFVVAGYSYGGVVGVEIASLLRDAGRSVRCIALLDTGWASTEDLPPVRSGVARRTTKATIRAALHRARRKRVSSMAAAESLPSANAPSGSRSSRSVADEFKAASWDVQSRSLRTHRSRLLPIPTLYVQADLPVPRSEVVARWRSLTTDRFEIVRMRTTHMSLLVEPWASDVASELLRFVGSVGDGARRSNVAAQVAAISDRTSS